MKKLKAVLLILVFGLNSFAQSQDDKAKAYEIGLAAIQEMDNGNIDKSIEMLKMAKELDPENFSYPYEIGYAYCLKKDYKNSIKTLKKVVGYKENSDECFALLGNVYDFDKQPKKAIEVYKTGLKKFPDSGRLHLELGIVEDALGNYDNALETWENGILVSPSYSSNYHAASVYFCKYTTEKIWGLLYGELFINLERNSKKTKAMSKLLFDTYKSSIMIKSKTEANVSFSESIQLMLPEEGEEMKLPFSMPYGITMLMAVTPELDEEELGIKSFNNIRTEFIKSWYENKRNIEYPNILFDWHKELIELNYFEPYNYWLLRKGDEEGFNKWYLENKESFDQFVNWFKENPMPIDTQNSFHRTQY